MFYYHVTAYDGFGKIIKEFKAEKIGWYNDGGIILTLHGNKTTFLRMPAIVVEIPRTPDYIEFVPSRQPHEVILYSFDGKVIRTWASEYAPASPKYGTLFVTKDTQVQIHGPVIING